MLDRAVRRALPGLAGVLALTLVVFPIPAAGAPDDVDATNEELRVSTARLQFAMDKLTALDFPLGGDDRRTKRDLVRESRLLMSQAATLAWDDVESMLAMMDAMAEVRARVDDFLDHVQPSWERRRRSPRHTYRSAYMEVVKFRDVAEDLERSFGGLNDAEREEVKDLIQAGDDEVAFIKEVRESDHQERDAAVRRLIAIRTELAEWLWRSAENRRQGHAFIAQDRTHHMWLNLDHQENGFEALRARFVRPQSAYVTVRNATDEARPLFVELEFFDVAGEATGDGAYETAPLEEIRPGEVREVLVPIFPTHPRFWDATTDYRVYLD